MDCDSFTIVTDEILGEENFEKHPQTDRIYISHDRPVVYIRDKHGENGILIIMNE